MSERDESRLGENLVDDSSPFALTHYGISIQASRELLDLIKDKGANVSSCQPKSRRGEISTEQKK